MSKEKKKMNVLRELFSDANNRMSSMRIMMMIGLIGGLAVMLANTFGWGSGSSPDYTGPLTALFVGIFGGKAWQSQSEAKRG